MIRKDTNFTIKDFSISDYPQNSTLAANTAAAAYELGKHEYYTDNMNTLTTTQKRNVSIHELGHVLGLEHSPSGNVMYYAVSNKTTLSTTDKASYDAAYDNY